MKIIESMKSKLFFLVLTTIIIPFHLIAQTEDWFKKGLDAKDQKTKVEYYTKYIQTHGPTKFVYLNRGIAKRNLKDYEGALSDFSMAIELDPQYSKGYFQRGLTKSQLNDYKNAIPDYSRAIEIDSNDARVYHERGCAKIGIKDYQGAILDLTKSMILDPKVPTTYYNLGLAKSRLLDYQGAQMNYSKAIELYPNYDNAYCNRALVKEKLKDYQGALTDISKAIELVPQFHNYYHNRGNIKNSLHDYQGALSDFAKAIELEPNSFSSYIGRAQVKKAMKDYQGAISDYSKALDQDPDKSNFLSYYQGLSEIYILQNNYPAAIEICKKELLINTNDPGLLDNLGFNFLAIGDYDEAIKQFNLCLKVEVNTVKVDAIIGLSLAYYYKNDKQHAEQELAKAKLLKPVLKKGMEGLQEFTNEGFSYSDKDTETLKKMFGEFK